MRKANRSDTRSGVPGAAVPALAGPFHLSTQLRRAKHELLILINSTCLLHSQSPLSICTSLARFISSWSRSILLPSLPFNPHHVPDPFRTERRALRSDNRIPRSPSRRAAQLEALDTLVLAVDGGDVVIKIPAKSAPANGWLCRRFLAHAAFSPS